MATNAAFFSPQAEAGGMRPVYARTDGNYLILPGALVQGGKRYDIRILRFDADKNVIQMDGKTPFSASSLRQIQSVAASCIFNRYLDPSSVKITYLEDSKRCFKENTETNESIELGKKDQDTQDIAEAAERIHELLSPSQRGEWTKDPNAKLVIYPTFVQRQDRPKASQEMPKDEKVPGTNGDDEVSDTESEAGSEVVGAPNSTDVVNQESLNLSGVTLDKLRKYAMHPSEKYEAQYEPILASFKRLIENPNSPTDETMKKWIQDEYFSSFNKRLNESFDDYNREDGGKDFEEWCQYHAANDVMSFIQLEKTVLTQIINYLTCLPIPTKSSS